MTKQKGRAILTLSGRPKNVFSGRQLGLVQEETLVVFYTSMPRETVKTTWNEVKRRKKFSPGASILFSAESWRKQTYGKTYTVWRPVLRLKLQIPCLWWARWKNRRVIVDIIPCVVVTSLETDAFMAIVAYFDMLNGEKKPSARSKRRYSRSSWYSKGKKSPRLCISKNSDQMNSVLRKSRELGLNASAGHAMKFLGAPGTKLNSAKIITEMRGSYSIVFELNRNGDKFSRGTFFWNYRRRFFLFGTDTTTQQPMHLRQHWGNQQHILTRPNITKHNQTQRTQTHHTYPAQIQAHFTPSGTRLAKLC